MQAIAITLTAVIFRHVLKDGSIYYLICYFPQRTPCTTISTPFLLLPFLLLLLLLLVLPTATCACRYHRFDTGDRYRLSTTVLSLHKSDRAIMIHNADERPLVQLTDGVASQTRSLCRRQQVQTNYFFTVAAQITPCNYDSQCARQAIGTANNSVAFQ